MMPHVLQPGGHKNVNSNILLYTYGSTHPNEKQSNSEMDNFKPKIANR